MRKLQLCPSALILVVLANVTLYGQTAQPLSLVNMVPIPNVKGRMDHLCLDVARKRLFVSALENGSVEVIDLKAGKWLHSIPGFQKPQGILYLPGLDKIFIASGDDGMVRVFSGESFRLLDSIKLEKGANRILYDSRRKLVYVGYGGKDAGHNYGEVGILDPVKAKLIATIQVNAHPAELLLDASGDKLFTLIPARDEVQVIYTTTRKIVATWPVSSKGPGDAALDESSHRLMIGTHTPPSMVVMDVGSGKEVASLPTVEGMDGVYFDTTGKRVYVSGGRGHDIGSVFVYQQTGPDKYTSLAQVPTKAGAGTSLWSPELNYYFVAAPARNDESASILIFQPQP
jgi:hypothetical protein